MTRAQPTQSRMILRQTHNLLILKTLLKMLIKYSKYHKGFKAVLTQLMSK